MILCCVIECDVTICVMLVGELHQFSFFSPTDFGISFKKPLWESTHLPIFRFHRNCFPIFKHDESRFSSKIGFWLDRQLGTKVAQLRFVQNAHVHSLLCTYNTTHISLTHWVPWLISTLLREFGWVMGLTELCMAWWVWSCVYKQF